MFGFPIILGTFFFGKITICPPTPPSTIRYFQKVAQPRDRYITKAGQPDSLLGIWPFTGEWKWLEPIHANSGPWRYYPLFTTLFSVFNLVLQLSFESVSSLYPSNKCLLKLPSQFQLLVTKGPNWQDSLLPWTWPRRTTASLNSWASCCSSGHCLVSVKLLPLNPGQLPFIPKGLK